MPAKRVSRSTNSSRRVKNGVSKWLHKSLKKYGFVGVSLGGGKTEKTSVALVEYFPEHRKIFLSELVEKIKPKADVSADQILFRLLEEQKKRTELYCFNVPLKLPKCMRCKLACPGYEKCTQSEIKWMRKFYQERNEKKRPDKVFTPYTERCSELLISEQIEEPLHPPHALGANLAPIVARAHYLTRRLKVKTIEVYPKLSLWRVGRSLGIQKSYLRFHKHSVSGEEARTAILNQLVERDVAFIYESDRKHLVANSSSFDAFLCALTGVLKFTGQVENRPKGFPKSEGWIEIPREEISWE